MKNKKTLLIAVVLVIMVAAIAVLAVLNRPKDQINAGALSVVQGENTLAVLTVEQLKALPTVEHDIRQGSASSKGMDSVFTGVTVKAVLDSIDPALTSTGKRVYAYAEDGFVLTYNMSEIVDGDAVFVAYAQGGEPLKSKAEGGEGPLRVIVAGDEHANRSCKYVYKLEVK